MSNEDPALLYDGAAALASVPLQVVINGQRLQLSARLWRDFQPRPRTAGKPLIATLMVEALDGNTFPGGWDAPRAWFVQAGKVWRAELINQSAPASEHPRHLIKSARGGPAWEPGSAVDIVVELRERDGAQQRLRLQGQIIQQVD
jgi:hypothetical protein